MKSLAFKLVLTFFVFFLNTPEQLYSQKVMTPKQILLRLIEPVVKDKDGVDFILHTGAFANQNHDQNTYYEWDATSVGMRLRGTFEHFEHMFVYGECFYRSSEYENKYFKPSIFTRNQGIDLDFGAGMKFPVPIGKTGFIFEGEFTTPFNYFNPVLTAQLKWENEAENFSASLRNGIVARDASVWNPGFHFEYRILPRRHTRK